MSNISDDRPQGRSSDHDLNEADEIEAFLAGVDKNLIDRTIRSITNLRAVSDIVDREDVIQNTRLALIQIFRTDRYQPGHLIAFVRRVTEIQVLREYRKTRLQAERYDIGVDPDANADARPNVEESRLLRARLERGRMIVSALGKTCRRLLILRYCRGLSYRDIGERVGLSEGATRVKTFRCLKECDDINARIEAVK